MKKLSILFLAVFVVANQSFSQCAMCKALAEQGSEELDFGYNINYGIIFLMLVPYIIIFLFFRKQIVSLAKSLWGKKKDEKSEN